MNEQDPEQQRPLFPSSDELMLRLFSDALGYTVTADWRLTDEEIFIAKTAAYSRVGAYLSARQRLSERTATEGDIAALKDTTVQAYLLARQQEGLPELGPEA